MTSCTYPSASGSVSYESLSTICQPSLIRESNSCLPWTCPPKSPKETTSAVAYSCRRIGRPHCGQAAAWSDIDLPQSGQLINGMSKLQSHTIRMDSRQKAIRPHLNHRYRVNPEQRNLQMLFT